jgi:tRNA A37 threonylcarbamoyladenosine modification protein TsaB
LGRLDEFLKSKKLKAESIKKIIVNKGPGSYTGVRVGVTHALGIGFAWKIPVKAVANEKFKIGKI